MQHRSQKRISAATIALAFLATACLRAQILAQRSSSSALEKPLIMLDPPTGAELQAQNFDAQGHALRPAPANFRRLGQATMGEPADLHTLTLRFVSDAKLTGISSTADFPIEGGTCAKGNSYKSGTTCTVLVRFTPQGPGNRLGFLKIAHGGSAAPDSIGLGGYGSAPVLSFTPSVIQTVPGTYVASAGLLNGAKNLATDGGDRLFIADTGNNVLRMIDSTGTIDKYSGNYVLPPPVGITVDNLGAVWFTVSSNSQMYEMPNPTLAQTWGFSYTDGCAAGDAPCTLAGETLYSPGELSADSNNNIFFSESYLGAAMVETQTNLAFLRLYGSYSYFSHRIATDQYDDLYSFDASYCRIMGQNLYDAEHDSPSIYRIVGGSGVCGFSGDGGDARNAEIGSALGQFAFDAAGDLYFTDSGNQRVRRIDNNTGIIRTIAGNGVAGYAGDGSPATSARLSSPTGLAVDSQGQVYIVSGDGSANATQVVRKITSQGMLAFGIQTRNTSSASHIVTVTNTGNTEMVLNNFAITGPNAADFAVDPTTTSCNLSPGANLASGNTCTVGVIFTPSDASPRSAKLVFTDNTVTNSNTVLLNGTGTLPPAMLSITSPTASQSFTAGTAITLSASVVGGVSGTPTGTIQFQVDGANFGSAVTLVSGNASTSVTGLSVGNHSLEATYSGDNNYGAAGPVVISISITAGNVASRVSLTPVLAAKGTASVTSFAVTVSSEDGSIPTGQVQLKDGTGLLAAGVLVDGHIVLKSPPLPPGVHSLTAVYAGDGHHSPAVSPLVLEIISPEGQCLPGSPVSSPQFIPRL